jgi:D-beta-D-heptose 7-phosphate kinase/D-beta-D-heptose 1-phosphate adenosyltransferase
MLIALLHGTLGLWKLQNPIIRPEGLPMQDKSLVFTNGCFDIIHSGHIALLAYCAKFGRVVVGLNSDESIKKLKGNTRPINSELDRKVVLESIRFVDEVIIFDQDTPLTLIRKLKPTLIVKGGDYRKEDVVGNDLAEVKIFPTILGKSTTSLIHLLRGN